MRNKQILNNVSVEIDIDKMIAIVPISKEVAKNIKKYKLERLDTNFNFFWGDKIGEKSQEDEA